MAELHIFVPGRPIAKGSAKWIRSASTGKSIPATNEALENWQASVAFHACHAFKAEFGDDVQLWNAAARLDAEFIFSRPKSHYRGNDRTHLVKESSPPYPIGRPDRGKLLRCVEDALEGVIYRDDAQVVQGNVNKVYGPEPGVHLWLCRMEKS